MKNCPVKILKNATVYFPEYLGKKDILIVNDRIVKIGDGISLGKSGVEHEVIDLPNKTIIPGLIDMHVHISGGGGEAGFVSRISPVNADTLALGGVTTVLGLLGTDGTTRTVADLYGNARRLEQNGISSFILTGSYEFPPVTLTGSVRKDILFVDKVIGVKTAISDHRATIVSYKELANLAMSARVAGMLAGKAGIVTLHVGDGKEMLDVLFEALEKSEVPIKHFIPTHLNRNEKLLKESVKYGKIGGFMDFTCVPLKNKSNDITAGEALKYALKNGVSSDLLTMSSDGNGSWTEYNKKGQVTKIGASNPQDLFNELRQMIINKTIPIETAIKTVTANPARILSIYPRKGTIAPESDADMVILNNEFLIESVIAKGEFIVQKGKYCKF